MKKLIIFFTILISLLSPTLLRAQEEESLNTNTRYFDISMERLGQSAWNKAVTYEITVTPKTDSPKTQILWEAPSSVDIKPTHTEFVDLYRNQTYTFRARVRANKAGTYEITANLIAWQHDANYTNSVSDLVTFNSNLLAQPVDPSYTYGLIWKYLIFALLFGVLIYLSILYGKKAMKKLQKWLTPPN